MDRALLLRPGGCPRCGCGHTTPLPTPRCRRHYPQLALFALAPFLLLYELFIVEFLESWVIENATGLRTLLFLMYQY